MTPTREDWEPEVGLADNFDGSIVDVEFGVRDKYAEIAGTTDPMLILHISHPEFTEPVDQAYSLGSKKQWEAVDGGKEVVSAVNPVSHRFNMNSRAGVLVTRVATTIGNGNKAAGQEFLSKRGLMTQAISYIGLNFHWMREPMKTLGGETRDVLMPVSYLGESSGGASAPIATKGKVAIGDETIEKLSILASGKTEQELRKAIITDPELKTNSDLMNQIFNKGLLMALEAAGKLVKDPESGKYA